MDFGPCRFFERTLEVRVEKGFGIAAVPAIAKSPNCKAGDGTAELRQVLSCQLSFPEPFFRSGSERTDWLAALIDGNEHLPAQVFVREGTRALATELGESREISTESLMLSIRGTMCTAIVVDERQSTDGALEGRALPEAGTARILDDNVAIVSSRRCNEPAAHIE